VSVFLPQLSDKQVAAVYSLWLAWFYHIFPTLSHEWHVFQEKFIEGKVRVVRFSTTFFSQTFLILRNVRRGITNSQVLQAK